MTQTSDKVAKNDAITQMKISKRNTRCKRNEVKVFELIYSERLRNENKIEIAEKRCNSIVITKRELCVKAISDSNSKLK